MIQTQQDATRTKFKSIYSMISLLSPGLDSPIATYLLMNQGFSCNSITFLNGGPLASKNKQKMIQIGNLLQKKTHQKLKMSFVDYDSILEIIQKIGDPKLTCILCKRFMIRTAVKVAKQNNAWFITNGDILGEQASQTLDNLYAIHQSNLQFPIIRPLIGFNKLDVIKISQKLGFYPLSIQKAPSCNFNPKYPETRANLKDIEFNEKKLGINNILEKIFENMEEIKIQTRKQNDL